jgi:hypothetical protein
MKHERRDPATRVALPLVLTVCRPHRDMSVPQASFVQLEDDCDEGPVSSPVEAGGAAQLGANPVGNVPVQRVSCETAIFGTVTSPPWRVCNALCDTDI